MANTIMNNSQSDSGTWQEQGLYVVWTSELIDGMINADLVLEFEGGKQHCHLSPSNKCDTFNIKGTQQTVSGTVELIYGDVIKLFIQARFGEARERTKDIHHWLICNDSTPCDATNGSKDLNHGWRADWWVEGAKKACMESTTTLFYEGTEVGTAKLSPSLSRWVTSLPTPNEDLECSVTQRIGADGRATLAATVPYDTNSKQTIHHLLAKWLANTPDTHTTAPDTIVIGQPCSNTSPQESSSMYKNHHVSEPRCCSCFSYPKAIRLPSKVDIHKQFISITNKNAFQSALASKRTGSNARKNMQTEAATFITNKAPYAGQCVKEITGMPTPFNRLIAPEIDVFLASSPKDLASGLNELLQIPANKFVSQSQYAEQKSRLQDSLTALLVLNCQPAQQSAIIAALMVCHAAEIEANEADLLTDEHSIKAVLSANILLDATIFPVPLTNTTDIHSSDQADSDDIDSGTETPYLKLLGLAELMMLEHRLMCYRSGKLAYVENVMRGQTREIATSSVQESISAHTIGSHSQDKTNIEERLDGQSELSPLLGIKKTFENIQQQYDSSGLNVTLSGDYFELPGDYSGTESSPFNYVSDAQEFARSVERQFVDKLESSVDQRRHKLTNSMQSSSQMHRYENVNGQSHLTGLYRWISEVFSTHLYYEGERLMVEMILPSPAANFIDRQNGLFDRNLHLPIAPYDPNATTPINSPADITRSNYLPLSNEYLAENIKAPPAAEVTVSQTLIGNPPLTTTTLKVPDQYEAKSLDIAYAYLLPEGASAVTLDLLIGDHTQSLSDPSPAHASIIYQRDPGASLPVAVITTAVEYAVTLTLTCQLNDKTDIYIEWQRKTFDAIMAAYLRDKAHYMEAIEAQIDTLLPKKRDSSGLGFQEQQLKQQGIQLLIKLFSQQTEIANPSESAWYGDVINFQLIPFFDCALSWGDMTIAYYPDYFGPDDSERPDWLKLEQKRQTTEDSANNLSAFIAAGAARIIVPIVPAYTLPVIYYLKSEGLFWLGQAERTPVFVSEHYLVSNWKDFLIQKNTRKDIQQWQTEIPTSMMILDSSDTLPSFDQGSVHPLGREE
ncbi:hypothetical protein [Marinomonas posidonica]|uniref:Uncharacterized protein n=1 Tax=Marinomonas posidonica (strain CECT 7376 / NCIMB 14433 / IVIA-Po-181) TaxID=491952 RepID=F6CSJ5_MARPP|nr:hypothetical protein [Marinomonas posidonica]AEF56153.1 hypothetical protein Mar181_3128 [Marinomonas posidonica IVIA-Po-181]